MGRVRAMVGNGDSTDEERRFLEPCRFHVMPRANVLASLIEGVILSWGWRRRAIAFISGAVGALALPPFSLFVLIAVPLTIAVWLIDGAQDRASGRPLIASLRAAFGAGWWMGFGYFLAGLWWVGSAFLVEADKFAWALPLAVVALPAALAVFPAAGFALARLLWSPGPCARFSRSRSGLALAEWARGLLFTGFPWNDLGMALGGQSRACPDRFARRPAWADVPDHRDLRRARDAVAGEREPAQSGADDCRGSRAGSHGRLRRVPAHGAGQRDRAGRETAPHPAQRRPGRHVISPGEQASDPAPLFRLVGARDLAGSIREFATSPI